MKPAQPSDEAGARSRGMESQPGQEMPWQDALRVLPELTPGTVLTDFGTLTDLDVLANNLGRLLQARKGPSSLHDFRFVPSPELPSASIDSSRRVYDGWRQGAVPPSRAMLARDFLGQYENIKAIILEDSAGGANNSPQKNFLIVADMSSTGQGVQGQAIKLCTVSSPAQASRYGRYDPISTTYKEVKGHSPEEIAEAIVEASSDASRLLVARGLKRVLSGGLPGLGKRR